MMADIDYILDLLDWNRTEEEQAEGLRLARQVKAFNVFLPVSYTHLEEKTLLPIRISHGRWAD